INDFFSAAKHTLSANDSKTKETATSVDGPSSRKQRKLTEKKVKNVDKPHYTRWLMKSEPESRIQNGIDVKFGIEDLKSEKNQTACWDGVRNYQARNFMRDQMKKGQKAFFYHSNC
ncbi:thymocyte nuclear protein 1-like, partial [Anneissia japonica]|uniref:thymocyte nuclear protein 1-like n=1 Tax=Anneissia japonica TaxID=1529436 RepID=UPI0014256CC6